MNTQTQNEIAFKRIKSDLNGNPRYVCHFLNFQGEGEKISYDTALTRSRELGGRKFHNKQFGGGIVFQMYEGEIPEMTRRINEIANSK